MKKIIFSITILCSCLSANSYATTQKKDSIKGEDLVNIWIEQSEKNEYIVRLYIQNKQEEDTVIFRSSFFIDDFKRLSHLLIYYCYNNETDSIECINQLPLNEAEPLLITYSNGKVHIPPKEVVHFEIPIRVDYLGYDIFFKTKFLFFYKDNLYICIKESNKIYMERYKKEDK